ncbi:MAG TPA: CoA-binding protein [Candidatus Bilamarchaeaceae archaeon]|nr:CoA-binding protein [Candidatus Bilamarchaeaceae archaeon]
MNEIEHILKSAKTIAVVGLSDKPERDSYIVAEYLQNAGYEIIPVNPNIREWKGIKAYASLLDVKEKIDVVDIFRRSEFIEEIVDQALAMKNKPTVIWMQLGIQNERAAEEARSAGMIVIQNKCMKIEHEKFIKMQ